MSTTHGMSRTKSYKRWCNIRRRCCNPADKAYKDYGGRGITMCDRWLNSFTDFHKDVGDAPSPEHTLDRIDNDKGYEPSNVRWATRAEQNANRRLEAFSHSKSGYRGIQRHKAANKWVARIWADGKQRYLGIYDTPELASEAYQSALALFNSNNKDIEKAIEAAMDLYKIEGEVPPELAVRIGMLRQLINEEYRPERQVTSQLIYDILYPTMNQLIQDKRREARIDELLYLTNRSDPMILDRVYIQQRITDLTKGGTE